mmetsp:Transcript_7843/g.14847  ORF Transcript_7843/g.14847 Transcript_7843/m.14847 type:complete len:260 (+) Transcript_7843:55-834(+)
MVWPSTSTRWAPTRRSATPWCASCCRCRTLRSAQPEAGHRFGQLQGLLAHRLRSRGGFLHQRGILLGHLVQLGDGLVDLLDAITLLGGGGGDLADQVGHPAHAADDLLHGPAGLVHQRRALLDVADGRTDQRFDLLGRLGTALGQQAHLTGHHRETAALLARTRRLHRRVQRQDVGLERNAIDHADDVGDLARAVGDALHAVRDLAHHLAAALGCRHGRHRQLVGLLGGVGTLTDRPAHLLHRTGGLLQAGSRLLRAPR